MRRNTLSDYRIWLSDCNFFCYRTIGISNIMLMNSRNYLTIGYRIKASTYRTIGYLLSPSQFRLTLLMGSRTRVRCTLLIRVLLFYSIQEYSSWLMNRTFFFKACFACWSSWELYAVQHRWALSSMTHPLVIFNLWYFPLILSVPI